MSIEDRLARGLRALGLEVDASCRSRLLDYLALLDRWNKAYNLTAVRNVDTMVAHHVLDSLAVLPHIPGGPLVDVGSGAGLPGIPLAIAQPAREVTLLDSTHKKCAFLRQAAIELGLANVTVVCERAEAWRPQRTYDVVISRAFAELAQFLAVAGHLCSPHGVVAAMKGVYPDEELAAVPAGYRVLGVPSLHVPGLDAVRHLVLLQPALTA